jgi:integrase
VFSDGIPALKEWQKIYKEFDLTHSNASKKLKEATIAAFPKNPQKHMSFNGLRHSYAKSLFEIDCSMGCVAKCLGNTEKVCQEYYAGWEHTPNSMLLLHTLAQQNLHKLKK